jgi:ATP-dependent DNA ligase
LNGPHWLHEIKYDGYRLRLEELVSKRRDRPYQGGRSKYWVKIKNRNHPAMTRVMDAFA